MWARRPKSGPFLTLLYCVMLVKCPSFSEPPYFHQYNKGVGLHDLLAHSGFFKVLRIYQAREGRGGGRLLLLLLHGQGLAWRPCRKALLSQPIGKAGPRELPTKIEPKLEVMETVLRSFSIVSPLVKGSDQGQTLIGGITYMFINIIILNSTTSISDNYLNLTSSFPIL